MVFRTMSTGRHTREWEDLVNEKSVIKNVINPRMTAMGELVDENGNPINGQ